MALLLWCLAAGGCGKDTATVSGTVTYNGKPLPSGAITFYGANGDAAGGRIGPDGHYNVAAAPVGVVKVTVVTSKPRQADQMRQGRGSLLAKDSAKGKAAHKGEEFQKYHGEQESVPVGQFVPIPEYYKDPERSGLIDTLKAGSQTIDVELKP